jgi:pimeloyl-ACP methyl ester carboxylesterase
MRWLQHRLNERQARLALQVLWILAALAGLAGSPAAALAQPPADRDGTDQILRRLGGKPCPGSNFTCVTLQVPLDHFDAGNSRKTSVVFAVLPATGKRKGMFVTATGGPGTSGLDAKDSYTAAFDASIRKSFDIVFFDQRGVDSSGGLDCAKAAAAFYQTDQRADTPAREASVKASAKAFARDCVTEMGATPLLAFLGTAQAVEDLDAFRQVMQEDKFWLYGESYGSQYAQTYAVAHPDHLAGLMLDGTVDLTLTGAGYLALQARAFNDTLVKTLQFCNADQACAADAGGDALTAYDHLATKLKLAPAAYRFPLGGGQTAPRTFTFANLETAAVNQLYNESDRMMFIRGLNTAQHGDLTTLARLLYLDLGLDPQTLAAQGSSYSDAVYYGVECQDYGYFTGNDAVRAEQYVRAGDPIDAGVPRLVSVFYGDLPCVYWPKSSQNAARPAPLTVDVPTLVLGATADPATPYSNGVSVYRRLPNAYLITQQDGPHIIYGRGNACPDDLVTAFLVKDQLPAQRETTCDGQVSLDYVVLAPADASGFAAPLDAFKSAETEISYLPEYYYWDGSTPTTVGCTSGGSLKFEAAADHTQFALTGCAFSRGWSMTGAGSFDAKKDRFVLEVTVKGVKYKYVRDGKNARMTMP